MNGATVKSHEEPRGRNAEGFSADGPPKFLHLKVWSRGVQLKYTLGPKFQTGTTLRADTVKTELKKLC